MAPPPLPPAANLAADTRPVPASRSRAPAPAPAHSRLWKAPFQNPPRPPPRPPRDLAHGHPCPRDPCPRRAMPSRRGSVAAARARSPPAPAMPTGDPPSRACSSPTPHRGPSPRADLGPPACSSAAVAASNALPSIAARRKMVSSNPLISSLLKIRICCIVDLENGTTAACDGYPNHRGSTLSPSQISRPHHPRPIPLLGSNPSPVSATAVMAGVVGPSMCASATPF